MKLKEGISVAELADGTVIDKANDALGEVIRNVLDPNTKPDAAREITIKIKLKPNDRRDLASVSIGVSTKLAAPEARKTEVFISQKANGEAVVSERDIRQDELFKTPPPPVDLKARRDARQIEQEAEAEADTE